MNTFEVKCEYCGNEEIVMAESEAQAIEMVSKDCSCGGYAREMSFKQAEQDIDELFEGDPVSEGFRDILKESLKMLKLLAIDSVTVKYGNYSGTISRRKKEGFKVSRMYAEKDELEIK